MIRVLFFLAMCICANAVLENEAYKSFSGYQVIRAEARTMEQGMALINLQHSNPSLDYWKEPSLNDGTDIMVPSDQVAELKAYLSRYEISHSILMEDVGKVIGNQQVKEYQTHGTQEAISWTRYHTLETITQWFHNLTEENSFVDLFSIGNSTEGRELHVLRLSRNPGGNNPAIFIDSIIHAREWISVATITYMINELVNNPVDNALLDDVDFYFLPVINPDGFEYTHTTNRMWRKTRSQISALCYGVDPNRNFDYEFDSCSGCSSGVCSAENFRGNFPFSEPETDAMRNFIETSDRNGVNFQSYISVHSYGQYFMLPWGYTPAPPKDYEELKMIADYVKGNISSLYGTTYTVGSSSTTIYPTDGTSQDWAYGTGIFKYTFTAELRDTGSFGFLLPADQIIPTAEETWMGFKVVVNHIIGK